MEDRKSLSTVNSTVTSQPRTYSPREVGIKRKRETVLERLDTGSIGGVQW